MDRSRLLRIRDRIVRIRSRAHSFFPPMHLACDDDTGQRANVKHGQVKQRPRQSSHLFYYVIHGDQPRTRRSPRQHATDPYLDTSSPRMRRSTILLTDARGMRSPFPHEPPDARTSKPILPGQRYPREAPTHLYRFCGKSIHIPDDRGQPHSPPARSTIRDQMSSEVS